ncbi:hypothetical protein [Clostridium uliginosum]|uniref:Transposase n=1 Tax=Clostridium uliginosum TaxID=119641 RepID=A0A1I1PQY8_9CLOT|nr:hypothetical protein [Clostridium uliginosum]SFD09463.1 conserved hypothetical protein (putative transposase or invertase) [Clostridium uliginosum]
MENNTSKITLKEVMDMELAIEKAAKKLVNSSDKDRLNDNKLWWKKRSLYEGANMLSSAEKRGEERGKKQKALEVASKLLLMGLELEDISSVIGLSIDELDNLKA